MRRIRLSAIVLLLAPLAAAAPQGSAPPQVDATRLALGRDSLAIYLIRGGDTTRTGTLYEDLARVNGEGGLLLVRWYRTEDAVLGARADSLVDRLADLSPVRSRSWSTRTSEALDFGAGRVDGWVRLVSGDSVRVGMALAPGVINAASFDVAVRAAPLAAGWSGEFPAFLSSSRAVTTLQARVAGQETVAGTPCWRVEAVFESLPVTFWVDQRTRRLRQQVMQVGPDARILFTGFGSAGRAGRSA